MNKHTGLRLMFLFIMISIVSCKKDNDRHSIEGNWELRISYNGQGGSTIYPAGNGYTATFTSGTYEFDSSGKTLRNGTYRIVKDQGVTTRLTDRIIYDNNSSDFREFIQLSGDTLSFFLDAYDAGGTSYVRR